MATSEQNFVSFADELCRGWIFERKGNFDLSALKKWERQIDELYKEWTQELTLGRSVESGLSFWIPIIHDDVHSLTVEKLFRFSLILEMNGFCKFCMSRDFALPERASRMAKSLLDRYAEGISKDCDFLKLSFIETYYVQYEELIVAIATIAVLAQHWNKDVTLQTLIKRYKIVSIVDARAIAKVVQENQAERRRIGHALMETNHEQKVDEVQQLADAQEEADLDFALRLAAEQEEAERRKLERMQEKEKREKQEKADEALARRLAAEQEKEKQEKADEALARRLAAEQEEAGRAHEADITRGAQEDHDRHLAEQLACEEIASDTCALGQVQMPEGFAFARDVKGEW